MFLDLTLATLLVASILLGLRRGALRPMLGVCGWIALLLVAPHLVPFADGLLARALPSLDALWLGAGAWGLAILACWILLVRGAITAGALLREGSLLLRLADSAAGMLAGVLIGMLLSTLGLLLALWWSGSVAPDGWLAGQREASLLVEALRMGLARH